MHCLLVEHTVMYDTPSLECRRLVTSENSRSGHSDQVSHDISVLQYNILADAAIPNGNTGTNITGTYQYCPATHRYMDSKYTL